MWKKNDDVGIDQTALHTDRNRNSPANSATKSKLSSTIGEGLVIMGEIKGNEDLLVSGHIEGTITFVNNQVTVGKTGKVKGIVNAKSILVDGHIEGNLNGGDRVVLRKFAKIKGNIAAERLIMEDGCHFQGGVDMLEEVKSKPSKLPIADSSPKTDNNVKKPTVLGNK